MDPHFARNMSEHIMPVFETDLEGGRGKRFDHFAFKTDEFFGIAHMWHASSRGKGCALGKKSQPTQKERF